VGEGELLLPGQGAAFRPSSGWRSCRARAGHVQVFLAPSTVQEGCPARRTPRGRCSCSGVASARTGVRTYQCALGRPLFAGAVSVGSNPRSVPFDSSALAACPRPSCGDVGEGLFTAAFVLRSSLLLFSHPRWRSLSLLLQRSPASRLEFVIPRAPWYGGCSYPRERNQSPVCNGTLSASVCSLWLSRPEHLGIRERSCVSSSFQALGLVCWLAEPLNRASVAFHGR
jgi:hypothetical protein